MDKSIQPILQELKAGLRQIYGDQLDSVILYGSYARGDAHPPDSDIDVMVVLKNEFKYGETQKKSSGFVSDLCLKYDVVISRTFATALTLEQNQMPFYINVRREGILV